MCFGLILNQSVHRKGVWWPLSDSLVVSSQQNSISHVTWVPQQRQGWGLGTRLQIGWLVEHMVAWYSAISLGGSVSRLLTRYNEIAQWSLAQRLWHRYVNQGEIHRKSFLHWTQHSMQWPKDLLHAVQLGTLFTDIGCKAKLLVQWWIVTPFSFLASSMCHITSTWIVSAFPAFVAACGKSCEKTQLAHVFCWYIIADSHRELNPGLLSWLELPVLYHWAVLPMDSPDWALVAPGAPGPTPGSSLPSTIIVR